LNGQEIIRIGDSTTSMQYANCEVRNNFFDRCNGEIEIISNKSCGNIYANNVFFECSGMLTLRHGNDCTVAGNYFFGNGVSNSGGVRIIGEDHKVYNNYFENLRGTNFRAALCIVRGKLNSVLNDYFQVKNAFVVFNTFVNCSQAFCVNYNGSTAYTMPPVGTVIAHNHVYNTSSSNTNVVLALQQPDMDISWKNNLMNIGRYTNISFTDSQVITGKNPMMQQSETLIPILEPQTGSQLTGYTTNEQNLVAVDIRGRERILTAKLPGASEIAGASTVVMPSKTTVGAGFFNKTTAVKPLQLSAVALRLKGDGRLLMLESKFDGRVTIHNLAGKTIKSFPVAANDTLEKQLDAGFYLISFLTVEGEQYSQKIQL